MTAGCGRKWTSLSFVGSVLCKHNCIPAVYLKFLRSARFHSIITIIIFRNFRLTRNLRFQLSGKHNTRLIYSNKLYHLKYSKAFRISRQLLKSLIKHVIRKAVKCITASSCISKGCKPQYFPIIKTKLKEQTTSWMKAMSHFKEMQFLAHFHHILVAFIMRQFSGKWDV